MSEKVYQVWNLAGGKKLAQGIFEEMVSSAILYKFRNSKKKFVPVGPLLLTDAIFKLTSHDEVPIIGRDMVVNGQKFKELFVTLIFARALETLKRYEGKAMFMTLPIKEGSADTGIFSVDMDGFHYDKEGCIVMTKTTEASLFQVKEYVGPEQISGTDLITSKPLDPKLFHIEKLKYYDEIILIYIRALSTFTTIELQKIFERLKGKKVYIIASFNVDMPQENSESIKPKKDAYNFVITELWADPYTTLHVWFENPKNIRSSS